MPHTHLQSQQIDTISFRWVSKINVPNLASEQMSDTFRANPSSPVE